MFQIIEVFLGFSLGIAVLWVTILALVKYGMSKTAYTELALKDRFIKDDIK